MTQLFNVISIALIVGAIMFCIWNSSDAQPNPNNPVSFGTAVADTIQAMTNQESTLTSTHYAFLFNDSFGLSVFTYYFELCAALQGCTLKTFTVTLQPHQSMNVNWMLQLQALYPLPGLYTITATTGITGPNTNVVVNGLSNANIIPPYLNNVQPGV
jgi:hypothetical protein